MKSEILEDLLRDPRPQGVSTDPSHSVDSPEKAASQEINNWPEKGQPAQHDLATPRPLPQQVRLFEAL